MKHLNDEDLAHYLRKTFEQLQNYWAEARRRGITVSLDRKENDSLCLTLPTYTTRIYDLNRYKLSEITKTTVEKL